MADARADVAIAGGGPVGAALALGLARLEKRVALIDRGVPTYSPGELGFDVRTVALNHGSAALMESLGVWRGLVRCPFSSMKVWESRGTRSIEFDARDVDSDHLGWIVEVGRLTTDLWAALGEESNVTICTGGSITDVEVLAERVHVRTQGGAVDAALLVAADGGHSTVRRLLGVDAKPFETGHAALATVVKTERAHGGRALQVFLPEGPLAFLPLLDRGESHFCAIVWSQPVSLAQERSTLTDAQFANTLEAAGEASLGKILDVDQRVVFPLTQRVAEDFAPSARVLLAGDAARVLHPLAGQGVNLGFEDVREVLEMAGAVPAGRLGEPGLWRGYARRRRLRAEILVRAMDAFRVVYGNRNPWFGWLRNVGVDLVNTTPAIKTQLIREAMGVGPLARMR